MSGRLLVAAAISAALVLSGPYIGVARAQLRDAFPGRFGLIVNTAIVVVIGVALAAAVARIHDRRAWRYAALVAALVLGGVYASLFIHGAAQTVVVERFHFVEYGLITFLFHRAWRDRRDLSTIILPALAALIVGTLDEGLQWFVPNRIGEWRDLQLNAAAIGCGLLFSVAIAPPTAPVSTWQRGSWTRVGAASALMAGMLAAFLAIVHLGYEIRDPQIGSFLSRYRGDQLQQLAAERAATGFRAESSARRLSREDQYLAEARWHAAARNAQWSGDVTAAWAENTILERYFAPALDFGLRWPAAQRADAASRAKPGGAYASRANALEIYTWDRPLFWLLSAAVMAALVLAGWGRDRRLGK